MNDRPLRRTRVRKVLIPIALGLAVTAPVVAAEAIGLPGFATAAPAGPTAAPKAPASLKAERVGSGVKVSWWNVSGPEASPIQYYTVVARNSANAVVATVQVPGSELHFNFGSEFPGIASVSVTATNAVGTSPASTAPVTLPVYYGY